MKFTVVLQTVLLGALPGGGLAGGDARDGVVLVASPPETDVADYRPALRRLTSTVRTPAASRPRVESADIRPSLVPAVPAPPPAPSVLVPNQFSLKRRPIPGRPSAVPPVYVVGKGVFGQPKMYVPGQPLRNVLRSLTF